MHPELAREIEPNRFGANVTVHNRWIRHSQKQSAEVFNTEKTGISASSISSAGAERAKDLGRTITPQGRDIKSYVSDSERTNETLDAIVDGVAEQHPDVGVNNMRVKEELVGYGPEKWLKLYDTKWTANKAKLLAERDLTLKDFSTLSPDDQEQIAEEAEEPVIQEWLDNPDSELAQLHPPRHAAAKFAALFNRRHDRLAKKLFSESVVEISHVTHKTVTEPFLASGVLIRDSDSFRITTIEQLGGSLRILDNWESETTTDEHGNPTTKAIIRGVEYHLDPNVLEELAKEGIEQLKEAGFAKQGKAQKKFKIDKAEK